MARELSVEVTVESLAAEAALGRLEADFRKTGLSIDEAEKAAAKFDKSLAQTDAKKKYKDEIAGIKGTTDQARGSTDALTAAVLRYAAPAAIGAAALKTIVWADNIEELAQRTSLSTTYVQQLTKVAEKNGTTFQTMANLIQQSEQRLASGNKKTIETIQQMGMSVEDLLALNPEARFRAIAKGIADIEDPATRSAAEMAVFGRAADGAAAALNAVAAGADKSQSALGPDFIRVGAQAQDMWENLTNAALDYAKAALLAPAVITDRLGNWAKNSTLGTAFEMMGLHGARASQMPALPGAQAAPFGMPSPLAAPGDPFAPGGVGGNSMSFIQQTLGIKIDKNADKKAADAALAAWWEQFNATRPNLTGPMHFPIAGIGPGKASPFMYNTLPNMMSGTSLGMGFHRDAMLPGFSQAGMVSPASLMGNQSLWGKIGGFAGSTGGKLTGAGLGLLTNLIPGLSGTGSSIGSMAGSFLGPLGAGAGGLLGGLVGKLFGGNKDKKAIKEAMGADAFKELQTEAERLGISMDKVFGAKKVKDFEKAVKDVTKQISDQEAESDKVSAAMERWGLTIEDMGKKFQQTEMNKTAKLLAEDFVALVDAGADVTVVIEKMGTAVNEFVLKSIQMGTEIPLAMKPIVDRMREQGLLVDENGEALSEQAFASIQWAQTMTQGFDKVTSAIERLIGVIEGIGGAFDDAAAAADAFGDAAGAATGGGDGGGDSAAGFSTGGVAGRDFRRPGHGDVFPALLRRGERVMPPGVGSGMSFSFAGASIQIGDVRSRAEFVDAVGEAFVSHLERRGHRVAA